MPTSVCLDHLQGSERREKTLTQTQERITWVQNTHKEFLTKYKLRERARARARERERERERERCTYIPTFAQATTHTYSILIIDIQLWFCVGRKFVIFVANVHPLVTHDRLGIKKQMRMQYLGKKEVTKREKQGEGEREGKPKEEE